MTTLTVSGNGIPHLEPLTEGTAGLADAVELSSITGALRRRLWPILLMVVVAVLLATAAIALLPRSYQAQTKVLVRVGREQVAPLEQSGTRFNNFLLTQRTETTNDEVEILRRPQLLDAAFPNLKALLEARRAAVPPHAGPWQAALGWLEQTWAPVRVWLIDVNLVTNESPDQRLRQRFAAAIDVAVVRETNILVVGFTWDDPVFAAEALNAFLQTYEHEHVRLQSDVSGMADLYRKQAARTEAELGEATAALNRFATESGASDPAAERQVVIVRLQELGRELNDGNVEQQQTVRQMAEFRDQFAQTTNWLETPAIAQTASSRTLRYRRQARRPRRNPRSAADTIPARGAAGKGCRRAARSTAAEQI